MSPASQGGVEVERYIGSCLISSTVRPGPHKPIVGRKQEPLIRGKSRGCYGTQSFPNGNEQQCQVQYGPGGWTGAPLISMTSSPRRCNQRSSPSLNQQQQQTPPPVSQSCDQQISVLHKNPLSRLAIHTQGAPLILANRFHNRNKIHNPGNANICNNSYVHNNAVTSSCTMNSNPSRCPPSRPQRPIDLSKKQQTTSKPSDCTKDTANTGNNSIANIDSLSIASDESSGSNNSENSLPRIIKPRKRRKKDRKPPNNPVTSVTEAAKLEEQQQGSPGMIEQSNCLKPYVVPTCYEQRCYEASASQLRNHRRPAMSRENVLYNCRTQETADARQRYRHVEVKVLDDNRNVVLPAQMRAVPPKGYRHHHHHHHVNSNVPRYLEFNEGGCEEEELGPCQCRYCDPSALIWDVDQSCYSPFLTPNSGHFGQMLFLARPEQRLFNGEENARGHREKDGAVLRRSWSDPTSYFSEEISAPSKDVGVIGDRGQTETGKRRTLWRGDSIGVPAGNAAAAQTPKGLEVSTEIVTSPNGHRDLEIKFYSPLPNAPLEEKEDEDFSDIWSYHESKLQQDFRTLLQAEE